MPPKDYTGLPPGVVDEKTIMPSVIETIDGALFRWVKDLNMYTETGKGWKKAEILWVSAERAFQIKHKKELRDINGILKLPLITVERTDITKSVDRKGKYWSNVPGPGSDAAVLLTIGKSIEQDETAKIANARSARKTSGTGNGQINFKTSRQPKPVIKIAMVPIPVYIETTYTVNIRTEYQQQMNELVTPFMTKVGPFPSGAANYFLVEKDGHKYEAFVQEGFSQENNASNMEEEERTYITKIEIKVLGYLLGGGKNADEPRITYSESVVSVRTTKERTLLGDTPEQPRVGGDAVAKYKE
jgi:hypothetical protein